MILGRAAARRGRRTLVCLANAPLRYADLLGGVALGPEPRRVGERFFVLNIDPRASREEYALGVLGSRTLHRLVFGSPAVRAFLDAVPGLAEWAVLGKASYHALAEVDGRPEYDLVVFDSPATGHGLEVLALPRAILSAVPAGRMREDAAARVRLMADPERFEVLPVLLPEEMVVNETIELLDGLAALELPVRRLVVNMVAAGRDDGEIAAAVDARGGAARVPDWLLAGASAVERRRAERRAIERLAERVDLPRVELPRIPGGSLDEASWLALARLFYKAVTGPVPLERPARREVSGASSRRRATGGTRPRRAGCRPGRRSHTRFARRRSRDSAPCRTRAAAFRAGPCRGSRPCPRGAARRGRRTPPSS